MHGMGSHSTELNGVALRGLEWEAIRESQDLSIRTCLVYLQGGSPRIPKPNTHSCAAVITDSNRIRQARRLVHVSAQVVPGRHKIG